jgi:hypothetical protein
MQYTILNHEKKLPHKQALRILLPARISVPDLDALTAGIAAALREKNERILIHWCLEEQDMEKESCWAYTTFAGTIHHQFNGQTLESQLDSVETRPLSLPGEIGLFSGSIGWTSIHIQVIDLPPDEVRISTFYDDATSSHENAKVISRDPFKFNKPGGEGEFYLITEKGLSLQDGDGAIYTLPRLR